MSLVRVDDNVLVSNDTAAWKAAKLRKEREKLIQSLVKKTEHLEVQVEILTKAIEEIKANE